jgi:hypothetical protein
VDVEIVPEPGPEDREALEQALRKLIAGRTLSPAYTSAWREAGIREAVEEVQTAGARPRSSFGATRA